MNGKKTALSLALGSAFVVTLAAVPVANATENPFGMSALQNGYLLAAAHSGAAPAADAKKDAKPKEDMKASDKKMPEGKCGEGKCGAAGKKDAKAKGDMKATDKAMPEGKCGEGKCGGAKKDAKPAAPAADKK